MFNLDAMSCDAMRALDSLFQSQKRDAAGHDLAPTTD